MRITGRFRAWASVFILAIAELEAQNDERFRRKSMLPVFYSGFHEGWTALIEVSKATIDKKAKGISG